MAARGETYNDEAHLQTLTLMRFLIPRDIIINGVKRRNPTPEMLVDFMRWLASQNEEDGFDEYVMEIMRDGNS